HSIPGQQNEHDEVRNQQSQVECIDVVETAKRFVEKMLPDVRGNPPGGSPRCQFRAQDEISNQPQLRSRTSFYRMLTPGALARAIRPHLPPPLRSATNRTIHGIQISGG